ncbi:MAG: hypothetical protein M3265_10390 [Actinomycetota bacterium]|nr:hypothetical protein [Actinomycetota bacterium]
MTAIRLVAWVPESAPLVVPAEPAAERSFTLSSTTRRVTIAGAGGVPADASAVIIAVRVSSSGRGAVSSWTTGVAQPSYGETFPAGTSQFLEVLRPGTDGAISLRAPSGSGTVGIRVLGWAMGDTVLSPRGAPTRLVAAAPGAVRPFAVAGTASIPADAQDSWVSVAAPAGASVKVWGNATGSGTPLHAWRSTGAAVSLMLPVPAGRRASIMVTGTSLSSSVLTHAWNSNLGNQSVTLVPRQGTVLLGDSDVVSFDGDQFVLTATADKLAAGNHVIVRDAGLSLVLRVESVTGLTGGRQQVAVTKATLRDALADLDASYISHVEPTTSASRARSAAAAAPGSTTTPLGGGGWDCGEANGHPGFDMSFTGSKNFDIDLAGGTIDFSVKGSLTSTWTLEGEVALYCTYSFPALVQVPIGAIPGVVFKIKPVAKASLSPPTNRKGGIFKGTSTQRIYAALYYNGGEPVIGNAFSNTNNDNSAMGNGSANFDLGIMVGFGMAEFKDIDWGPELGVTAGATVQIGPPQPPDDVNASTKPPELAGPRCSDASVATYAEIGGSILLPFWPDAAFDLWRDEGPLLVFHRGPCVGYTGTITYKWKGSYPQGGAGCTAQSCPSRDWDHTIVRTMQPGMASFNSEFGVVVQPYSWTWNGREIVENDVPLTYDGQATTHCVYDDTFTGGGTVGWSILNATNAFAAQSWQGWVPDGGAYASSAVLGEGSYTRDVSGDPEHCGEDGFGTEPPPKLDANGPDGGTGLLSIDKTSINTTLTGHPEYRPEWAWTITFALTRVEYER